MSLTHSRARKSITKKPDWIPLRPGLLNNFVNGAQLVTALGQSLSQR
jgi:hypothetical protein